MRRALPILLAACVTPALVADVDSDHDDTLFPGGDPGRDDTATLAPGDTADTTPAGTFLPTVVGFYAEFAVDDAGALASWKVGGQAVEPAFEVALADDDDGFCLLVYELDDAVFATYADGRGDTWRWLDRLQSLQPATMGFRVEPGRYVGTAIAGDRCGDLPAAWTSPDLFEYARTLGPPAAEVYPTYVGVGGAASTELRDLAVDLGYTASQAIGGAITLPFQFDTPATDTMGAFAVWAAIDSRGNLDVDGQGQPRLQRAADATDHGRPSAGWYRVVGQYTFTAP